jgi:hypothetical protein
MELTKEELNKIKADVIMNFVNNQVGAFEASFVDGNTTSLYSMYRYAQIHIKDCFGVNVPDMRAAWGDEFSDQCKTKNEIEATKKSSL